VRIARLVALGALLVSCWIEAGSAHTPSPEQVIALVGSSESRARYGVERVERHAEVARLLLVRVGPAWADAPAEARRAVAESWLEEWSHAVPGGIVAVLDARTDRALVNYDAHGRARLAEPRPAP
jgi:hypothetical protein